MNGQVLLTGSTGLVGGAIRRQAAEEGRDLRLVSRSDTGAGSRESWHRADLAAASLSLDVPATGQLNGLIHAASYIGTDEETSLKVNLQGTRRIVEIYRRLEMNCLVYVSTAGVYGEGHHRGTPETAPTNPSSFVSRHRLEAERIVREAGGIVVRPHLVVGLGDTRVLPGILRAIRVSGGIVSGGEALVSILSSSALARQIWAVLDGVLYGRIPPGTVINADSGRPVPIAEITELIRALIGIDTKFSAIPLSACRDRLEIAGFSNHQIAMLSEDNWFDSSLRNLLSQGDAESPALQLTMRDEMWYREMLGTT